MALWSRKPPAPPEDPWNDETLIINDKPVTLRLVRKFAVDNVNGEGQTPWEIGMAMTIVALCDEINFLHRKMEGL